MLGLVGESGCGKTMTARSLMGLLPRRLGLRAARSAGRAASSVGPTEKELTAIRGREIALISQEPMVALDPMFSVAYQLTQPIRRFRGVGRAEARKIARSCCSQVGIVDAQRVLKSYPHQLSGGMAQRVCIALALTGEPKLLIADEPTTALDVTVQAEILSLLRALVRDTGLSMIIVSHDLGVVADICDDVAVMYAGQVVESGLTAACSTTRRTRTRWRCSARTRTCPTASRAARLASIPGTVPAARLVADRLPVRQPLPVRPGRVHDAVPGAAGPRRRVRCSASACDEIPRRHTWGAERHRRRGRAGVTAEPIGADESAPDRWSVRCPSSADATPPRRPPRRRWRCATSSSATARAARRATRRRPSTA